MKREFFIVLLFITSIFYLQAQSYNQVAGQEGSRVITTAVPFLIIGPDARSGGMGEVGVASDPDANSMHWNPAKYAFIDKKFGFAMSYSPWLRALVNDITWPIFPVFIRLMTGRL